MTRMEYFSDFLTSKITLKNIKKLKTICNSLEIMMGSTGFWEALETFSPLRPFRRPSVRRSGENVLQTGNVSELRDEVIFSKGVSKTIPQIFWNAANMQV